MSETRATTRKIAVIGGGAAGFFAAINIAEKNPADKVMVFEKTGKLLQKVKISGGSRCNVTHGCFIPTELAKNYPRGGKQLVPLFRRFQPRDTIDWFGSRGVEIKIEADQRAFPESDKSQTIIDCFLRNAEKNHVEVKLNHDVAKIELRKDTTWRILFRHDSQLDFDRVVIASGSAPSMWKILSDLGHTVVPPVPSLFTFNIKDERIRGLQGVSFADIRCRISGTKTESRGPMLITHWGLSGPVILKLSAFGARELFDRKYRFDININFFPDKNFDAIRVILSGMKELYRAKLVKNMSPVPLPSKYWKSLLHHCQIPETSRWLDVGKKQVNKIADELANAVFRVEGKSTFKEEFVTCGGIDLDEVDLETMESRLLPKLYFTGEVLDIDAITGGFNFQAAWTTAWIVSESIS